MLKVHSGVGFERERGDGRLGFSIAPEMQSINVGGGGGGKRRRLGRLLPEEAAADEKG